ncbi:UNVERIFIED_CONTAM: putative mitochondrial protein [Sesamum radiatum]|uniref:Mitochondrial protein n=1 Tax=Sesamum radiatum TaxID=300843 RepID=A0AAW2LL13_SESRA
MLVKLGFDTRFLELILSCVTLVSYSFLLNGSEFGLLILTRGLCQGDPLSPYLFLIFMETFSVLLQDAKRVGHIKGIAICKRAPSISHLLFANDTQIYCEVTHSSISCIKDLLETYAKALGQVVSYNKLSMVLSRNSQDWMRETIPRLLSFKREEQQDRYLG